MHNNVYLSERLAHERQRDLERTLRHQALVAEARAGLPRSSVVRRLLQRLLPRYRRPTLAPPLGDVSPDAGDILV